MKLENEITVEVTTTYEKLHKQLIENGFVIKDEYFLDDWYMAPKDIDFDNLSDLEIIKNCILVRNVIGKNKVLVYKYKEYDNNGDIIRQGKIECPVKSISKAIDFMESINYRKLFNIKDKCIVYANGIDELAVQLVNDKYIFIEIEDECDHINKRYKSIDEMKRVLDIYDISYDNSNYFVKKAHLVLNDTKNDL